MSKVSTDRLDLDTIKRVWFERGVINPDILWSEIEILYAENAELRQRIERLTWIQVPSNPLDNITGLRCRICWAKYPTHAETCIATEEMRR